MAAGDLADLADGRGRCRRWRRPPRWVAPWTAGDLGGDLVGGLGGLVGQALDLVGDHGEALAGFAGPGRLDGGVQGQQVGLAGDVVDQA